MGAGPDGLRSGLGIRRWVVYFLLRNIFIRLLSWLGYRAASTLFSILSEEIYNS